jgi:hypothetical protein
VACTDESYFSTLSHKKHDFREGGEVTGLKISAIILSRNFFRKISYFKKKSEKRCDKFKCLRVKFPLFLTDFNKIQFSRLMFRKNNQKSDYNKALSGGDGLFHVDKTVGQTDKHDVVKLHFPQFRQRLKFYKC